MHCCIGKRGECAALSLLLRGCPCPASSSHTKRYPLMGANFREQTRMATVRWSSEYEPDTQSKDGRQGQEEVQAGRASFWRRFSSCSFLFSFPSKVCQSSSEVNRFIPTRIIGGEFRKKREKYKFRLPSFRLLALWRTSAACLSNRQMFLHKHEKKEGDSILRLGVQCGYDGCNTGNAITGQLGHTGRCGPLDPLLNYV